MKRTRLKRESERHRDERAAARRIDVGRAWALYSSGHSLPQISELTGYDSGALSRALRRAGHTLRRTTDYAKPVDVDVLARMYVVELRGVPEIARMVGISRQRVTIELRRHGVTIRPAHRQRRKRSSTIAYETEFERARPFVRQRSGGLCEARTPNCTGAASHVHHRKMRSQLGSNDLGNLLDCCARCHLFIHAHPAESYDRGWLVHAS